VRTRKAPTPPRGAHAVQAEHVRGGGLHSEAVRLVDLGGGTGNFTQALVDANALQQRPLCVDPYQEMLDQATSYPAVDTYCRGAVEFADEADRSYDRVLLKVTWYRVRVSKETKRG
jgi:predicted TPR repeat methyltransferase